MLQLTAYYPRRLQEPMGTTGKKKSFFLTNYASSSLEKSKNNMGEQSGVRKFSTSVKTSGLPLNPNFISGFTDGDGSFSVVITKCANRLGWTVSPIFTIGLHAKDLEFLNIIQSYFGVGKIYTKQSDGSIHYRVWSVKDLINIIIPHFDKYPLVTQKRADFELFKQIVQILAKKEKLTIEDLTKIVALKASINLGLSPVLKESFPNITPALRTVFDVPKVLDPHWLAGFIEAEGSFVVSIQKSYNNKNGFLTSLRFILSQHSRDLQLMNSIMKYFNCGLVYSTSTRGESVEFRMNKFLDVWNTLIPFLKKYPLQGSKLRDFSDFAKAAALMYSKDHLTIAGLDKIVNIKKGMNQLRQMSSMATAAVQPELKKERETLGWALIPEYPLIILFILIGAIFLMSSSDLVSMFLAIELQSYGLYIFATLYRNSELATSAGLTYFLLGGLSSCFILLGSCLLYLNFGITNLDGLYVLSSLSEVNGLEVLVETNQYFNLALLIMSVGYLFKVSAAPFHFWSPAIWSGKSYMWERLPNSGDLLELLIPNYIRKAISGWTNHSCKVTSQKAYENNVEYRGSKSDLIFNLKTKFKLKSVKEQRVDGSHCINFMQLRYTLLDFERNSQIKIPSNQIQQRRLYSTVKIDKAKIKKETNELTLLRIPWFVTGFSDAEGSFIIVIRKALRNSIGWQIEGNFTINIHKKDVELLKLIQAYFGGIGRIGKERNDCCDFTVSSLNQILNWIIPHFDKYPLITQKRADYLLFREVIMMMERREHLTVEGLQAIINIRATLNKGLTPTLKEAFPNSVPVSRPTVENPKISTLHPQWVAGFTSGDGNFGISIRESKANKAGGRVTLIFVLTQHSRDEYLMWNLVKFFGCGQSYSYKDYAEFKCQAFLDNYEKILPFFRKYPIIGVKSRDFEDWCKVAELINGKAHLTTEGFDQIRQIKAGMNRGRDV